MGTKAFLTILLLCIGLIHTCTSYPSRTDSSEEDDSQQQQQQNINSESLEEFTQQIQAKGRKPPKLQMAEKEAEPKPSDPCLDTKRDGPCKAYVPRYFFNQASGSCEHFGWGGCAKNGNNFKELTDCETSCAKHLTKAKLDVREKADEPKNVTEICEKPSLSPGMQCLAYIPRWTYSSSEQNCIQFVWGGCGKTENNFATESLCQATCGDYSQLKGLSGTTSRVPTTTEAIDLQQQQSADNVGQNTCDLPSDAGMCYAAFERYYFNKLNNRCELFTYGGCGGNKNRFDTAEACVRACGGDSPSKDLQCSDVECPWALYEHYASLGCSPIYDGEACCPTRYECPDQDQSVQNNTLESRSLTLEKDEDSEGTTVAPGVTVPQKCRYRGKQYSVGEMVDEASDTGSCRAGCICTGSDPELGPSIVCAQIECPEHLGGRPRGKEHCIPLYKKGSCCAFDYHCPEGNLTVIDPKQQTGGGGALAKCELDGDGYYEGQRVYPNKSPCAKCLCQRNPANATSLKGQLYCEKVDCGIEIYYSHNLARGCAPVYYEKEDGTTSCCPISWECPEDKQQESETTTPESSVPEPPRPPSTDGPLSPVPPSPPAEPEKPTSPLMRSREVCQMEKVEGSCKGHRSSFFFNSETKKCENFVYTGCGGNLNNFASLEDCKELCESTLPSSPVPPSPPAKGSTKTTGGSELLGRSRRIETAPRSQETKSISLTEVDPCTLSKRVGRCKGYFPRFFYSPEDNECQLFIFGGCHPNANNFYSKESCEATCLNSIRVENLSTNVPAELASPNSLRRFNPEGGDSSKVNFGEDNRNPELRGLQPLAPPQEEENSECQLLPRTGRCKAFVQRFYYDTDKKMCKTFTYGGCTGNANNFHTLEECDEKCKPKKKIEVNQDPGPRRRLGWRIARPDGESGGNWASNPDLASGSPGARNSLPPSAGFTAKCKLPKSTGSCHNSIRSYYYDAETKNCRLFFYSGCFGNANRFNSREDCETQCKKPLESEGSSATNETANQPNKPKVHELGGGSDDNRNGGQTQEPESLHYGFCKLDPVAGDCKANQLRFYYDSVAEQCLPFVYSGCKGNLNNFVTETECMSSCGNQPTVEQLEDDMVLSCQFGNKTLPLGSTVGGDSNDGNEYIGEEPPCGVPVCRCITPPSVTCVQRICPEPTTTTRPPPKLCATPTCLHFCRETIGQDGCPTCDCPDNERSSQSETITKQIPVKSVKG